MSSTDTSALAISGAKWVTAGTMLQRLLQICSLVVLARLLTPKDFGLIAVAMLILGVVNLVKELGMPSALIQQREKIQEAANTLFYLSWLISLVFYVLIFLAASPLAAFFKSDGAAPVLRVMGLHLFLQSASIVQQCLAAKEMQFKKQMALNFGESLVGIVVSIYLAVRGLGIWALVWGSLAGPAFSSILWWLAFRWRPTLRLDWGVARSMIRFGLKVTSSTALINLTDALNRSSVGRLLGVTSLGIYDMTMRIIGMPFQYVIFTIGQRLVFPAFCHINEDRPRLKRWYLKMLGYSCLLMAPIAATFLLLADQVVSVALGPLWMPTVPLIRILTVMALLLPLWYTQPVFISMGRPDLWLRLTAVRFAAYVPLVFLAARQNLTLVCWTHSVLLCFFAPLNLYLVMRLLEIPFRQVLAAIGLPMKGMVLFVATLLVFRSLGQNLFGGPNLLSLLTALLPASAAYLLTIYLSEPQTVAEFKMFAGLSSS